MVLFLIIYIYNIETKKKNFLKMRKKFLIMIPKTLCIILSKAFFQNIILQI